MKVITRDGEKIKLLEFFGGIGAVRKAFERLDVPFEVVDYVENDEFAVKSYNAMFGTNFEPQDISKWNKDIDVDLIMHGSPCQRVQYCRKGRRSEMRGQEQGHHLCMKQ